MAILMEKPYTYAGGKKANEGATIRGRPLESCVAINKECFCACSGIEFYTCLFINSSRIRWAP